MTLKMKGRGESPSCVFTYTSKKFFLPFPFIKKNRKENFSSSKKKTSNYIVNPTNSDFISFRFSLGNEGLSFVPRTVCFRLSFPSYSHEHFAGVFLE